MKKIIIVGGGGHGRVMIDAILEQKEFAVSGIIDPRIDKGTSILGIEVLGSDDMIPELFGKGIRYACIGVGSVGDCGARKRIYENLKEIGFTLAVVKHPKAVVAKDVTFEEGAFVAAGAVINTGARIGKNAIINTSSVVEHDCRIGSFVHIAPGAILGGGVIVGDETHIGMGAKIIQSKVIGKKCFIRANSTIASTIGDGGNV